MNLTLEDIGRLAGVSRSTVSRVINNHASVRPDVRARVQNVIQQTGYAPNVAARSLVSGRTGVIGLVIPSRVHSLFEDPYFARLIVGISAASNASGNTLSLFLFQSEEEDAELYPRVVTAGFLDGLLITATRMADPLLARLVGSDIPVVMMGRPDIDGFSYVDADNHGGARMVADHLCSLGHENIAYVGAPANTTAGVDRLNGFIEGLGAHDRVLRPNLRVDGDYSEASGYAAMEQLLPHRPDAVFAASDQMATGVLRALRDHNVAVPNDIAVVGFDGLSPVGQVDPPLTTVRQPVTETGSRAVEVLNRLIEGSVQQPITEIMPVELVVRESSGASRSETG